jgi:hypothetical protein
VRARGGITACLLILSTAACAARRSGVASPPAAGTAAPSGSTGTPGPGTSTTSAEPPLVRDIVLEGITAFPPAAVYRAIVLRPGGRLRRDPSVYASDLERRYAAHDFVAARVTASWDAERGVLTLHADEGRLQELQIEGVEGGAADQARELLGLKTGQPVTEKDLRAGVGRLEKESGGAFRVVGEPPWSLERLDEGVRVRLALASVRVGYRLRVVGPDPSPLGNRVEGFAPGAGFELTFFDQSALEHARVYARASYGFSSNAARFAVGAQRPFAGQRLVVGYEFHDLTDTDDIYRRVPVEFGPGVARFFLVAEDYYRRRGHEAYAFLRPSSQIHAGVSWRRDDFQSMPVVTDDSVFFLKRTARVNPAVQEGDRDVFLVTGRWSSGAPLYANPVAERDSFLVRDLYGERLRPEQGARVDASLELGGATDLGGASYRRFIGHLRGRRDVSSIFAVTGRLLLGLGSDLPRQRLFALGGANTLRGYSLKTFVGDDTVLATVEGRVHLGGRAPAIIGFYDGGAAWTGGITGAGWRDDVGLGLEWPTTGIIRARVDGAYALRPPPGQDRARVYATIVLPF